MRCRACTTTPCPRPCPSPPRTPPAPPHPARARGRPDGAPARPGRPVLECALEVWGRGAPVAAIAPPLPPMQPPIDEDAIRDAAKRLKGARRPLIVAGAGALDASAEVTELSRALQAPVLAYRRGRGVLDSRDPFSVTLPLGREL